MYHDLLETLIGEPIFPKKNSQDGLAWSIRNNLQLIFETRRGKVKYFPDYGVPDLSDICNNEDLTQYTSLIKKTIKRYEPRLNNVEVSLSRDKDDVFIASFFVIAEMTTDGYHFYPVVYNIKASEDYLQIDIKNVD
ncbi:Type VI secretion system, lysozyme-related protein [Candidatus Magnetomorum sp. HK-1]|nr:Type VI secretion system, lysozyme-related protein [Candidatus Magnetomorum sp. HK-1]